MSQPDLFGGLGPALPEGVRYQDEVIGAEEEAALLAEIAGLPFAAFEFRGYLGARRVVSFGWKYDFGQRSLHEAGEMPGFLAPLRAAAGRFAGIAPASLEHVLVTEYQPGAPIGWHRDRPEFGEVVGVSLNSPCRFRFRRRKGAGWERAALTAQPRSAYLLSGPARSEWEHSIPPVEALRYSVTFRTLRG